MLAIVGIGLTLLFYGMDKVIYFLGNQKSSEKAKKIREYLKSFSICLGFCMVTFGIFLLLLVINSYTEFMNFFLKLI